jgi:hypothetical protein
MVKRLGLSGLIALGSAFLMVAAGIALCRFSGEREATGAAQTARDVASDRLPEGARTSAEAAKTSVTPEAERPGAVTPGSASPGKSAAPDPATSAAAQVAGQSKSKPTLDREAAPRYPLPPFPAPDTAPGGTGVAEASTGPAPDVLWLSGVIQGNPKLALLRRGEKRYLVKEGGTFESYRVVKIGSNSVTIQRGSRKRTLRVGQY